MPQLSNSCQQPSATGTEQEGGCKISMELLVAFRFVECNSPKRNLAQDGASSTLGRNEVKLFLSSDGQHISLSYEGYL